jgi:hypothetical protein
MTAREFYENITNGIVTEVEVEFAKEAIAKLDKRNADRKAKSSEKKANEDEPIKAEVLAKLEPDTIYTASEVADFGIVVGDKPLNTSKATVILKALVADGAIVETDPVKIKGGRKVKGYKIA